MYIANPIYDVVFKYLMEDAKIAKLMISSIIGENITRLSFLSQEFTGDFEEKKKAGKGKSTPPPRKRLGLTVYRLDFSARIKTAEGEEKQVIIELQKAKFPTDIMRFRKYLGSQLINRDNTRRVTINGKSRKIALPIISIYFLGHNLDHTKASAIKVSRQYIDLITNEIITEKESFIESLTLDSYVIQIPSLTTQRRNELEILLSVFDQSSAVDQDHHILNMNEADFPQKFRPIIRKLHQAVQNQEVKTKMELEDGIIDELEEMEREIEALELKNQQIAREKAQAEAEKAQAEAEKAQAEAEKAQAEAEKAQAEANMEEERQKMEAERRKIAEENEALKRKIEALLNAKKD